MPSESEIFERIIDLEKAKGRTEEWRSAIMDRLEKLESSVEELKKIIVTMQTSEAKMNARQTLILGGIMIAAEWFFKR